MFLLCALKQRAARWTKDYFCCPILEQKKWWAEGTCLCMRFSHSMRGTFGKWLFLYRQRCFTVREGNKQPFLSLPGSTSAAVLSCLSRQTSEGYRRGDCMLLCPLTLVPKHIVCEPWGLSCLRINHLTSLQRGPPTWNIYRALFSNHFAKAIIALFFPSYFILLFSHPQWILVWALSWTGQLAGETLSLGLRTGWLQKLLPVMRIQMLHMITE